VSASRTSYRGRILLITRASRGIGAATARLAGARGYSVAVNYRNDATAAARVVADIRDAGGTAVAIQADVSNESEVCALFDAVDRELGRLDALVNNAGIVDRRTRVEAMTAARVSRMFAVNVVGPFLCAREAVKRMSVLKGGGGGAIVNVSSGASRFGSPDEYVDYAASKGALDTFTIGLAKEVASEGIRVNGIRPGLVHTEIHTATGEPDRVERIKRIVPLQRGGQPYEIAGAILWLLSDEASYATGSILDVTGGL
jgi:NAD(P)-dependent dehydrogenase (short-subunit alcohol dehydrogenase family)